MIGTMLLEQNLQKLAAQFKATGDLDLLLRHAQEAVLSDQLAPKRPGGYNPVELPEFVEILKSKEVIGEEDATQAALNAAAVQILIEYVDRLPEKTRALTGLGRTPKEALNPHLWPNEKELGQLCERATELIDSSSLGTEQRSVLLTRMSPKMLGNALEHVLGKAFLEALALNLWKNPLLAFLPKDRATEFIKTATLNKGARLTDLISALRIAIGQYAVQMIADNKRLKTGLVNKETQTELEGRIYRATRKIAILDAYIDFLTRAQAGLIALMTSDSSKARIRYKNGDLVSTNPFIAPNFGDADTFQGLIRPNDNNLEFETRLWDDAVHKFTGFRPHQQKVIEPYINFAMQEEDFIDKLAGRMTENARFYKNHARASSRNERVKELGKIFVGKDAGFLTSLYQEIVVAIERAQVMPTQEEFEEGHEDLEIVRFNEKQKIDSSSMLLAHQKRQQEALDRTVDELVSKYEPHSAFKGDLLRERFGGLVYSVAFNEVLDPLPADVRFFKTVGDLGDGKRTFDYQLPTDGGLISKIAKEALPEIKSVLGSNQFQAQYAINEREFNEWSAQIGEEEDPVKKSLEEGKRFLSTPAGSRLLRKIGIDPDLFKRVRDPVEAQKEFGKMLDRVFARTQEQIQADLYEMADVGQVSLDSLYSYLGDIFTFFIKEQLAKKISMRWTAAVGFDQDSSDDFEEKLGPRDNQAAKIEAEKYIDEWFLPLQLAARGTKGGRTLLKPSTAAALIAQYHLVPEARVVEGKVRPFEKLFKSWASKSFGNFIKEKTRKKINDIFAENKEAAKAAGDRFRWNEPGNEKPRENDELLEVIGAFADPIPGKSKEGASTSPFGIISESIEPGERLSQDQLDELRRAKKSAPDTAYKHYERIRDRVLKIGFTIGVSEIVQLQQAFARRRQEILEIDPRYIEDIIEFKIADKERTNNPFVHAGMVATKADLPAHTHIATPGEAEKFIADLPPNLLDASATAVVQTTLVSMYPRKDVVVWSSNKDFARFFDEKLSHLISDQQAQAVLQKIAPDYKRAPKAEQTVQEPMPKSKVEQRKEEVGQIKPVEPSEPAAPTAPAAPSVVRRRPGQQALIPPTPRPATPAATPRADPAKEKEFLERVNALMRMVIAQLEASVGKSEAQQQQQLQSLDDTDEFATKELRKLKIDFKNVSGMTNAIRGLEDKLHELRLLKATVKEPIEQARQEEAAIARADIIAPMLKRVTDTIMSTPKWGDVATFDVTQTISTLMSGNPAELARPEMLKFIVTVLGRFAEHAENLQAMRARPSLTPLERKRTGKDVESRMAEELKAALDHARMGAVHEVEDRRQSYTEEQLDRHDLNKIFKKE